jgi:hypothetical protein
LQITNLPNYPFTKCLRLRLSNQSFTNRFSRSVRIKKINPLLITILIRRAHSPFVRRTDVPGPPAIFAGDLSAGFFCRADQNVRSPPPLIFQDERTDAMGNSKEFKNFRIWMALGTVAIYIFLVVTGNA